MACKDCGGPDCEGDRVEELLIAKTGKTIAEIRAMRERYMRPGGAGKHALCAELTRLAQANGEEIGFVAVSSGILVVTADEMDDEDRDTLRRLLAAMPATPPPPKAKPYSLN